MFRHETQRGDVLSASCVLRERQRRRCYGSPVRLGRAALKAAHVGSFTARQAVAVAASNGLDGPPVGLAMDGDDVGRSPVIAASARLPETHASVTARHYSRWTSAADSRVAGVLGKPPEDGKDVPDR